MTPLTVSSDWSLVPSGLGPGDRFRLMFISSGGRNARPTSIDTYNTWIQNLAAAGHTDIRRYSSTFNVVGSTEDMDARDNTGTTYTSSDKGVAIYWLNGNKVADQYQDFYDGSWDEEASMRNQNGGSVSAPNPSVGVWTGSAHDGTEGADSMGDSVGFTTIGKPNSGGSGDGPLRSNTSLGSGQNKKLYGLSDVFEVRAIEVPADWSLIPSGLGPGDQFRLLFISSATRTAEATDIATYTPGSRPWPPTATRISRTTARPSGWSAAPPRSTPVTTRAPPAPVCPSTGWAATRPPTTTRTSTTKPGTKRRPSGTSRGLP